MFIGEDVCLIDEAWLPKGSSMVTTYLETLFLTASFIPDRISFKSIEVIGYLKNYFLIWSIERVCHGSGERIGQCHCCLHIFHPNSQTFSFNGLP